MVGSASNRLRAEAEHVDGKRGVLFGVADEKRETKKNFKKHVLRRGNSQGQKKKKRKRHLSTGGLNVCGSHLAEALDNPIRGGKAEIT